MHGMWAVDESWVNNKPETLEGVTSDAARSPHSVQHIIGPKSSKTADANSSHTPNLWRNSAWWEWVLTYLVDVTWPLTCWAANEGRCGSSAGHSDTWFCFSSDTWSCSDYDMRYRRAGANPVANREGRAVVLLFGFLRGLVLGLAGMTIAGPVFGAVFGLLSGVGLTASYAFGFSPTDDYVAGSKPGTSGHRFLASFWRAVAVSAAGVVAVFPARQGLSLLFGLKLGLAAGSSVPSSASSAHPSNGGSRIFLSGGSVLPGWDLFFSACSSNRSSIGS